MLRRTAIGALMAAPFAAVLPPLPVAPFWTETREWMADWPDPRGWIVERTGEWPTIARGYLGPELTWFRGTRSEYRAYIRKQVGDEETTDLVMVDADLLARSIRTWDEWRVVKPGPKWPNAPDYKARAVLLGTEARPFRARDAFNAAFAKNPVTR